MLTQETFLHEYKSIICPGDPSKWRNYVKSVWIKYQIAHYLQPKRIVELGVRAGYSSWALWLGARDTSLVGYDNYAPGNQGTQGHEAEIQIHAQNLYGLFGGKLVYSSTQDMETLFVADLYHVDADHTLGGAYNDILLCMKSNPEGVIVVHDANADAVCKAIEMALGKDSTWMYYHIDTQWGDAVLSRIGQDWVDKITLFDQSLVEPDE